MLATENDINILSGEYNSVSVKQCISDRLTTVHTVRNARNDPGAGRG